MLVRNQEFFMKPIANILKTCLAVALANSLALAAENDDAIAKIKEFGGQVLGIAQNTEGVRVLIPPKTFEGRVLTDDDLAVLKDLNPVIELDLKNAGITDAGLKHLSPLTQLERLHLEKTKVTDAGLIDLKGLTKLKYLNLYGTGVSDAGLEHLKGLGDLRNLYLWQTKVTFEAAQKFHEAAAAAGNENLEINLGWEKEILSKTRLAALKAQREKLETEADKTDPAKVAVVEDPDFKTHILPIFQNHCVQCHGEEKQKEALRLDSYEYALKGSEHGAVVVAEDLIESTLFQRITLPKDDDDIMPPKDGPLSKDEIALIKNWIANGAKAEAEVKPAATPKIAEKKPEGSSVFVEYVLPIFQSTCVDCHGEEKQKAGLRLDSIAAVLKGGKEGAVVAAGKPEESPLYQRITLPKDDDDIMPPKGDPLNKAQTDLIKLWIASGAK